MKRLLPLLLYLCLCLAACTAQQTSAPTAETPLLAASPVPVEPWPAVPVYVDGLLTLRGYDCDGELYLCPMELCRLFGIDAEESAEPSGYQLRLPLWTLEAPVDAEVYTADGRYLYCPSGYRSLYNRVYCPADISERLFGVSLSYDGRRADLDSSGFRLLEGGPSYYDTHFHADDLFWLSHIIYAEAHWESLAGQIGVGSVVLNRVKSDLFPQTVMAVVLDREHITQFDPVESGDVTAQPDEQAMLAACLCLEGYNTVGDSLYFVNPERGDERWFENALTPTVTIGHHIFYS